MTKLDDPAVKTWVVIPAYSLLFLLMLFCVVRRVRQHGNTTVARPAKLERYAPPAADGDAPAEEEEEEEEEEDEDTKKNE